MQWYFCCSNENKFLIKFLWHASNFYSLMSKSSYISIYLIHLKYWAKSINLIVPTVTFFISNFYNDIHEINLLFIKVFAYVDVMYRDTYRISIKPYSDTYRIDCTWSILSLSCGRSDRDDFTPFAHVLSHSGRVMRACHDVGAVWEPRIDRVKLAFAL